MMSKETPDFISKKISDYLESPIYDEFKFDLTQSNPTLLFKKGVYSYVPDSHGDFLLRKKITKFYKKRISNLDPNSIFITTGSSESFAYLIKLFCNPGDEVLLPSPGYPLFEVLLELESLNYQYYRYTEVSDAISSSWRLDLNSIKSGITERTKIITLVNPNNPLGVVIQQSEWMELESLLIKHNIILVIDEVFRKYPIQKKIKPEFLPATNLVILDGLSKSYAAPGIKISWMIFSGTKEFLLKSIPGMEIITDSFLSVSHPSQELAKKIIRKKNSRNKKIGKIIIRNYSICQTFLKKSSILEIVNIGYGWFLPIKILSGISEERILSEIPGKINVKVFPGSLFHFPEGKYFVISLLNQPKIFKKAVRLLVEYFKEYEII